MGFPQASNHNGFSGLYCTTIALLRSNSFTKCFLKARCLFPIETLQMFLHDPLRSSQSSTVMSGVRLASSSFHIQRIPAKKQTIETCGRSSLTFLSCLPKLMLSSTCCELLKLSTHFCARNEESQTTWSAGGLELRDVLSAKMHIIPDFGPWSSSESAGRMHHPRPRSGLANCDSPCGWSGAGAWSASDDPGRQKRTPFGRPENTRLSLLDDTRTPFVLQLGSSQKVSSKKASSKRFQKYTLLG